MNFDTKYLIRWGIPGWLFLIAIGPYILWGYSDLLTDTISNKNLIVLGTFVTLAGVPLGYFFNQIHHLIGWVLIRKPKGGWNKYFEEEIEVDNLLAKENNEHYRERYRYLLTKKHEVGGVLWSFIFAFMIVFLDSLAPYLSSFEITYLIILGLLILAWSFLRGYASANIDKYFEELLKASRK